MPRLTFRALAEWGSLTLFSFGVAYFVFTLVSRAAGICFALLPLVLFANERLVGQLPPKVRGRVQIGVSLGYLGLLWLLLGARG